MLAGSQGAEISRERSRTYPPTPQQLGSVTLRATETATAASTASRVQLHSLREADIKLTRIPTAIENLETSLTSKRLRYIVSLAEPSQNRGRSHLRTRNHALGSVDDAATTWESLKNILRVIDLAPVDCDGRHSGNGRD